MNTYTAPTELLEPRARLTNRAIETVANTAATVNRIPHIFWLELGGASVSAVVAKQLTAEHPGIAMTVATLGLVCTMGALANSEV